MPTNELERLQTLYDYRILDTLDEEAYDDITFLASQICGAPMALVTFIDKDRQWIKSSVGLNANETSRDHAFCAHAILRPHELMTVPDATEDDRFIDNPMVTGGPQIRFYAGAPLVTPNGSALGTLCVIDQKPRDLTEDQKKSLQVLSKQIVAHLELRKALIGLEDHVKEHAQYEQRLEAYQLKLEEINEALSAESQTDKLTGLSNRRFFDEILAEEYDRAERRGRPLSMMMIDVDKFKTFNDQFGHRAGDDTLKRVAAALSETRRSQDFVARYGGEEFVLLLPNTPEEGALILAERIRKAVQNSEWNLRPVTISVGVCTYSGGDFTSNQFMEATDEALYASKANGRNRVTMGRLE